MRGLFQAFKSGFQSAATKQRGRAEMSRGADREDVRSFLLSIAGTALLSVACLIVLLLQWEQTGCAEGRAASGECFGEERPDNAGHREHRRHVVDETHAPSKMR